MKQLFLLAVFSLSLAAPQARAQEDKVLTGPLTVADLIELPGWFGEDYLRYQPTREYVDRIPEHLADVDVLCFLGTWCSDSKRDVPRMIRIFQVKNIDPEKLQMIGLDRNKRSPGGEEARYGIERVPTFVFLRNGEEIGRIVEQPLASLEKDMLGIIDPEAGSGESGGAAVQMPLTPDDGHVAPDGSGADPELQRRKAEEERMARERHEVEMKYEAEKAKQAQDSASPSDDADGQKK